jgi:hypothetical protein
MKDADFKFRAWQMICRHSPSVDQSGYNPYATVCVYRAAPQLSSKHGGPGQTAEEEDNDAGFACSR